VILSDFHGESDLRIHSGPRRCGASEKRFKGGFL